jgi:hypothetical protein
MTQSLLVLPLQLLGFKKQDTAETERPLTAAERRLPMRSWEPFAVFLLTLLPLALLAPRVTTYLNPVTGDEPFYLMTAISLWQDGDLNECNNYRQHDEARLYPPSVSASAYYPAGWQGILAPYPLPPHPAHLVPPSRQCLSTDPTVPLPADGSQSELYSKHGLGLTLMVLVPFVTGGRPWAVYFLIVVAAVLAANVYLFARESTRNIWPAVLTWMAFAFTVPQMPYSYLIFPELPAALFVLYAFRRIRLWRNNWLQWAGVGFSLAFLPWLHYRFAPLTVALVLYFVYQDFRNRRDRRLGPYVVVFSQLAVSAALLMVFFYQRYRSILPDPADHAGTSDLPGTLRGAAGLFLDQQWGLFVAAPIYILVFVGVFLMLEDRERRRDLLWLSIVFVPYFVLVANYAQWWGEWCPPARYLASILPLAALPFSLALDTIRNLVYYSMYALLQAASWLSMWGFMYQPKWMYNQPTGQSELFVNGWPKLLTFLHLQSLGNLNPARFLPSFVVPYFQYLQVGKAEGDRYAAAAWSASIGPAIAVAAIVLLGLLVAPRVLPAPDVPAPAVADGTPAAGAAPGAEPTEDSGAESRPVAGPEPPAEESPVS